MHVTVIIEQLPASLISLNLACTSFFCEQLYGSVILVVVRLILVSMHPP